MSGTLCVAASDSHDKLASETTGYLVGHGSLRTESEAHDQSIVPRPSRLKWCYIGCLAGACS